MHLDTTKEILPDLKLSRVVQDIAAGGGQTHLLRTTETNTEVYYATMDPLGMFPVLTLITAVSSTDTVH